jgi:hypothetical protein
MCSKVQKKLKGGKAALSIRGANTLATHREEEKETEKKKERRRRRKKLFNLSLTPYTKINSGWRSGSNSRAPALQVRSPEFMSKSHKKQTNKQTKNQS